jgi:hypothetical protein
LGGLIVAVYKYPDYLEQNDEAVFDQVYNPDTVSPYSGIYRCMGCHREIGLAQGYALPAEGHHAHTAQQGPIRRRLLAWADHRPKWLLPIQLMISAIKTEIAEEAWQTNEAILK